MQLVLNTGERAMHEKNKHMQLDLSAHTKMIPISKKTPVAISVDSISAVSRVRSLMSAGSFSRTAAGYRAYDKRLGRHFFNVLKSKKGLSN